MCVFCSQFQLITEQLVLEAVILKIRYEKGIQAVLINNDVFDEKGKVWYSPPRRLIKYVSS
jgi:hypothetical protein